MCRKYILFFNCISIDKIGCIGKIKIKFVAKKIKNKNLIVICKVNKGQNCKKYILNCDGNKERDKS